MKKKIVGLLILIGIIYGIYSLIHVDRHPKTGNFISNPEQEKIPDSELYHLNK